MTRIALGELFAKNVATSDPRTRPDEEFELWSIPSFDIGRPEIVIGSEIGSAKKSVEPGDVLLSRIVPHIRRSWVVRPQKGRRQIASTEWIVFRNPRFHPAYLKQFLVSDEFHSQFMQTVAGVGGSLLRARPAQVGEIEIPFPPLAEQRRIAAILDQADDLRRKRREALNSLNSLIPALLARTLEAQSPTILSKTVQLESLVRDDDRINYGVVQPGAETEDGVALIRVESVVANDFRLHRLKKIYPKIEAQYKRSRLKGDEILVACVGSIGAIAYASPTQKGFNIARAVARVPVDPTKADRTYVAEYLRTPKAQSYFRSEIRAVAQPTLNIKQLCETPLPVPPLAVQRTFAARVAEIDKLKVAHRAHLTHLDSLFASLQHRAFRGEL